MSDPCNGDCNVKGNMKICLDEDGNSKCIPNHQICPKEGCGFLMRRCNSIEEEKNGKCLPVNNREDGYVCEENYDWNMTIVDSNGRECKYHKRWICNGKVVCSEIPCNNELGVKNCPMNFYLCGNECKPDFISCQGKCTKNGFFCERQIENVTIPVGDYNYTSTTFGALGQKRVVNLKNLEFHDYSFDNFRIYSLYINMICTPLYQDPEGEKCCLPMSYRCDGTVECWDGDKTVMFTKAGNIFKWNQVQ